jgi:DNA polymerase V
VHSSVALVDCNAFFCSCEILFRPYLMGKPVGVLSNNDGCFVSLTKELKALGVPMGAPYFKYKDVCNKNKVGVFSSNFSLYTNISDRVMYTLSQFTPLIEMYSVDEAFLDLSGFTGRGLTDYGQKIKSTVENHVGIPVCIGIAPTKVLAKIATKVAKKSTKAHGVVDISDPKLQDIALQMVAIEDVWGIGRANSIKFRNLGIKTAKDLKDYKNDRLIKKMFTKVGLQIKEELEGKPRFDINVTPEKKKQIMVSRTFGKAVHDIESLKQSVANYVSSACEKLRKQQSVCSGIEVFMRTDAHKNTPQYYGFDTQLILSATSDTRKVLQHAFAILNKIYRPGYAYRKAGVRLIHLVDKQYAQMSLLENPDTFKTEGLMASIDSINSRDGAGTAKLAACGVDNKAWAMNRNHMSERFVTGWSGLMKVK